MSVVERDPNYDWVEPIPSAARPKKGMQCGQCGRKFEYGMSYGHTCVALNCPIRLGGETVTFNINSA